MVIFLDDVSLNNIDLQSNTMLEKKSALEKNRDLEHEVLLSDVAIRRVGKHLSIFRAISHYLTVVKYN